MFDVVETAGIVDDVIAKRIVKQRVGREITPQRIFLFVAVGVVAQNAALLADLLVVIAGVTAKRRHFDHLTMHEHMRQTKAATDQAAATKYAAHLFRCGVGGNIVILGLALQQQIAHCTTDQIGGETGLLQITDYIERGVADVLLINAVIFAAGDDGAGRTQWLLVAIRVSDVHESIRI